jgi:hypothetical protein
MVAPLYPQEKKVAKRKSETGDDWHPAVPDDPFVDR